MGFAPSFWPASVFAHSCLRFGCCLVLLLFLAASYFFPGAGCPQTMHPGAFLPGPWPPPFFPLIFFSFHSFPPRIVFSCHCSSHPCCSQLWLCQSSQVHFSQASVFWVFLQSSGGVFACHLAGFGWLLPLPLLLLSGGDGLPQSGEGDEDCLILPLALFKA